MSGCGPSRSRPPCSTVLPSIANSAPPRSPASSAWPKSTACRMLSALAAGGLLERAAAGRYRLSLRVFELGLLAAERMPVREAARPVLIELHQQVHEMVQLGVPVAGHVAYIDRYGHAGLGIQLSGEVLRRVPGYSSSSGRVLAAFDEHVMAETLAVPRRKHTPFTITDTERLGRVLRTAREAGWVSTGKSSRPATLLWRPRCWSPGQAGRKGRRGQRRRSRWSARPPGFSACARTSSWPARAGPPGGSARCSPR